MPTAALTDRFVKALQPTGRQVTYHDEKIPEFGVRVGAKANTKTWIVRYRTPAGTRRQMKLGRYPSTPLADARDAAKDVLGRVARGEDPAGEKRREGVTVRKFAEEYLEKHAKPRKRSWEDDERKLNKDVLPAIGHLRLGEVGRRDLVAILDRVAARGSNVGANRTRALLSKFFGFAMDRGLIDLSPAQRLPRYAKEKARDRVLAPPEIEAVWSALGEEHPVIASLLKMALLTGARMGEVAGMRAEEIEGTWWEIPGERTKNEEPHRVPLSPEALAVLAALQVYTGEPDPYVFPSPRGGHIKWWGKAVERIREASGVEFRAHDLRRTCASGMAELGTPRLVVKRVLNHADASVTGIYDRYTYDKEARDALNAWGAQVREIVEWSE